MQVGNTSGVHVTDSYAIGSGAELQSNALYKVAFLIRFEKIYGILDTVKEIFGKVLCPGTWCVYTGLMQGTKV